MHWPAVAIHLGWLLACAAAVVPASAEPQVELGPSIDRVHISGVVRELAAHLSAADRLATDNRWQDAVDAYLDLLQDHGDALIPIDAATQPLATGQRFVQARWLVHQRIAALGPDAWKAFRNRSQLEAQQRFTRAAANRDSRALRRVIDEAFCTPAAAHALELLGDLALERGDFAEAEYWWRLLAAPASDIPEMGKHRPLLFPDPSEQVLARVRAKQMVSYLFQEQGWRVAEELKSYKIAHGAAVGDMGGRRGNYASLVAKMLDERLGQLPDAEQDWPTFGGSGSRNRPLPYALSPRWWAEGPAWRVRLDSGEKLADTLAVKQSTAGDSIHQPPFFPIIVGDCAFVADARLVRGFDLRTGRLSLQYDLGQTREISGADHKFLGNEVKFTLTAAHQHLLVRLGSQRLPVKDGDKRPSGSWLVCLRIPRGADDKLPLERWAVQALAKDDEQVAFEGSPVVACGSAYILRSRWRAGKVLATLCCYHLEKGTLLWEQDLVEAPESGARCPQHLLTLAGPYLVCCSHAGAVIAVDAASGKCAWAVRYAGRDSRTSLVPAVAIGNQVLVAPADLDRLLCLDLATGRSLWQREAVAVGQLLGVSHDLVVFTTLQGLRTVQLQTGDDGGGWSQPAVGSLRSCGRGILADGRIFWPTEDKKLPWRCFHLLGSTDASPAMLRFVPPGNAAVGRGCLVIATSEELWGFTAPPALLGPPQT